MTCLWLHFAAVILIAFANTGCSVHPTKAEPQAPRQVAQPSANAPAAKEEPPAASPSVSSPDPAPKAAESAPRDRPSVEEPDRGVAPTARFYFDLGSDRLRDTDQVRVRELAAQLKEDPLASVVVEGYSDSLGSRELNLSLAYRRAENVAHELERLGVPGRRVRVVSYGEERSQATARSRRVDIRVMPSDGSRGAAKGKL